MFFVTILICHPRNHLLQIRICKASALETKKIQMMLPQARDYDKHFPWSSCRRWIAQIKAMLPGNGDFLLSGYEKRQGTYIIAPWRLFSIRGMARPKRRSMLQ
jgi:hypothetical protein